MEGKRKKKKKERKRGRKEVKEEKKRLVEKRCSFLTSRFLWFDCSYERRNSRFYIHTIFYQLNPYHWTRKKKKREIWLESMTKTWQPSAPVTPFLIVSHFHRLIQERFMRIHNKHLETIRVN